MPLRVGDIQTPFMAALYATGRPLELHEIADWINAKMPLDRGPVRNDGTLGRTRDKLEDLDMIKRDATGRRYMPTGKLKRAEARRIEIGCTVQEETHAALKEIAQRHGKEPQELVAEGIGLVLKAYGQKRAA